MINHMPPQLWLQAFTLGTLVAVLMLAGLYIYRKGTKRISRLWGSLRTKWMYRKTEKRRNRGRNLQE